MNDNHAGSFGFLIWGFFTFFGMFTAENWSLVMGGAAGLCTAIYFIVKTIQISKSMVQKKEVEDEDE